MKTREEIEYMIISIIEMADYDLGKSYDPDLSELPDEIDDNLKPMVQMVTEWLKA